jgi:hypothetical protein
MIEAPRDGILPVVAERFERRAVFAVSVDTL